MPSRNGEGEGSASIDGVSGRDWLAIVENGDGPHVVIELMRRVVHRCGACSRVWDD